MNDIPDKLKHKIDNWVRGADNDPLEFSKALSCYLQRHMWATVTWFRTGNRNFTTIEEIHSVKFREKFSRDDPDNDLRSSISGGRGIGLVLDGYDDENNCFGYREHNGYYLLVSIDVSISGIPLIIKRHYVYKTADMVINKIPRYTIDF